jgi:hypothetical protein
MNPEPDPQHWFLQTILVSDPEMFWFGVEGLKKLTFAALLLYAPRRKTKTLMSSLSI